MTRRRWSQLAIAILHECYADTPTKALTRRLRRPVHLIYQKARALGLRKSAAYLGSPHACRLRRGDNIGASYRFRPGHVPANKGIKGWQAGGRSIETQFKKGQVPVNWMPIGSLRENADGYVDMKIREAPGARAWRGFHRILWEDAHGPIPHGYCLRFRDGDHFNIDLDNLVLMSRGDNLRRNSIHNLPQPLRNTIVALGQLKRRINEKQDRRSA